MGITTSPLFAITCANIGTNLVVNITSSPNVRSDRGRRSSHRCTVTSGVPVLRPDSSGRSVSFMGRTFRVSRGFSAPIFVGVYAHITRSRDIVRRDSHLSVTRGMCRGGNRGCVVVPNGTGGHRPVIRGHALSLVSCTRGYSLGHVRGNRDSRTNVVASSADCRCMGRMFNSGCPMLGLNLVGPLPMGGVGTFTTSIGGIVIIRRLSNVVRARYGRVNIGTINGRVFKGVNRFDRGVITRGLNRTMPGNITLSRGVPVHPPIVYTNYPRHNLFCALGGGGLAIVNSVNYCALNTMTPLGTLSAAVYVNTDISDLRNFGGTGRNTDSGGAITIVNSSAFVRSNIANLVGVTCGNSGSAIVVLSGSVANVAKRRRGPAAKCGLGNSPYDGVSLRTLYEDINVGDIHIISPCSLTRYSAIVGRRLTGRRPDIVVSHHPYTLLGCIGRTKPVGIGASGYVNYGSYVGVNYPTMDMVSNGIGVSGALYANYNMYTRVYGFSMFGTIGRTWNCTGGGCCSYQH